MAVSRSRAAGPDPLPPAFAAWFRARGWSPHAHQLAMIAAARDRVHALLIAPTGGGKTLAGFLPSLIELAQGAAGRGLHTLYVSPLKALATDVARNLETPIEELGLAVRAETRSGDTPANRRLRQRRRPPDLLLTTPESLALLLSYADAPAMFGGLRAVVLDELHALAGSKRGHMLALGLARLRGLAPEARFVGLSATVRDPGELAAHLAPGGHGVRVIEGAPGPRPEIDVLIPQAAMPWGGHLGLYGIQALYARLCAAGTTLVFVNTRAQAELVFQGLWRINEHDLPIALHHGSLATEQRRKVEAAMARGALRAVVCTSSLDLGIDWGDVDLVVQVGAPKGAARLVQRIGRANHRLDEPSRALLLPGNRFEVLECTGAIESVMAGTLDGDAPRTGALDVLAQHLVGIACSGPFDAEAVYAEVSGAAAYADLDRATFDAVLDFVATGGYALGAYERWRRLAKGSDGLWRLADARLARAWRMNVGTIVEQPTLRVRLGRGRVLGEVEEYFAQMLTPGDSFLFAGRLLRFEGIRETEVQASLAKGGGEPKIPAYAGGRMPLSTHLADRVRALLADPARWPGLPAPVRVWLDAQRRHSQLPAADELLIESFPRSGRQFLVAYCFAGRSAHQTLGMLLTRRMQRAGLGPHGFVATDYAIAVWSAEPAGDVDGLFDVDMLGDDLEDWMAESSMLKRTFRNVAVVAGLIERRHPGQEKTRRQVTFNSDLIYDVLRKYEPDHVLLKATRAEAAAGLTDIRRLADLLVAVQGRIRHLRLPRVSPLAVPVLVEIGRESVAGEGVDDLLSAAAELAAEAMGEGVS